MEANLVDQKNRPSADDPNAEGVPGLQQSRLISSETMKPDYLSQSSPLGLRLSVVGHVLSRQTVPGAESMQELGSDCSKL